jgi:hypothetical protein
VEQLSALANQLSVCDLTSSLGEGSTSLANIAAIIKGLDLVISCDTAIAHLAGALGTPTWNALRAVPDWRWLLQREDSPWYPGMRLFRQSQAGEWDSVFERMVIEVGRHLRERSA